MKTENKCKQPQKVANPPTVVNDNPKTSGIMMRGYGAATKGRMARGPMG
jgi:hypothetical protein